jgi:hypothetical protein
MAPAGHATRIKDGSSPATVMALAVCALALPSAVLAYSTKLESALPSPGANQGMGAFAPGHVDPHLARALATRPAGQGAIFRFTPAGLSTRPDRSVTVAVRVDEQTAKAIVVRGSLNRALPYVNPGQQTLHIASSAYSLGIAHGYQGFTPTASNFTLPREARNSDMPDLSTYSSPKVDNSAAATVSRLAPRVQLEEKDRAGRSPRTLEAQGEQSVDVGGSYRVSRNFNVMAGVRYSQDRDRSKSLSPDGKSDSQAVYVGTQFHF